MCFVAMLYMGMSQNWVPPKEGWLILKRTAKNCGPPCLNVWPIPKIVLLIFESRLYLWCRCFSLSPVVSTCPTYIIHIAIYIYIMYVYVYKHICPQHVYFTRISLIHVCRQHPCPYLHWNHRLSISIIHQLLGWQDLSSHTTHRYGAGLRNVRDNLGLGDFSSKNGDRSHQTGDFTKA